MIQQSVWGLYSFTFIRLAKLFTCYLQNLLSKPSTELLFKLFSTVLHIFSLLTLSVWCKKKIVTNNRLLNCSVSIILYVPIQFLHELEMLYYHTAWKNPLHLYKKKVKFSWSMVETCTSLKIKKCMKYQPNT